MILLHGFKLGHVGIQTICIVVETWRDRNIFQRLFDM